MTRETTLIFVDSIVRGPSQIQNEVLVPQIGRTASSNAPAGAGMFNVLGGRILSRNTTFAFLHCYGKGGAFNVNGQTTCVPLPAGAVPATQCNDAGQQQQNRKYCAAATSDDWRPGCQQASDTSSDIDYAMPVVEMDFVSTTFESNWAHQGGAMFLKGNNTYARFYNSSFVGNRAPSHLTSYNTKDLTGEGGVFFVDAGARLDVDSSVFESNTAIVVAPTNNPETSGGFGGAINIQNRAQVQARNSSFVRNFAAGNSGAVHIYGSGSAFVGVDTTFESNTARSRNYLNEEERGFGPYSKYVDTFDNTDRGADQQFDFGGAMLNDGGSISLNGCGFRANVADSGAGKCSNLASRSF